MFVLQKEKLNILSIISYFYIFIKSSEKELPEKIKRFDFNTTGGVSPSRASIVKIFCVSYLFLQVIGEKRIIIGIISRRPSSIFNDRIIFENAE